MFLLLAGLFTAYAGESEPDYTVGSNSDVNQPTCTNDYCTPANNNDNIACAALWASDETLFLGLHGTCSPYIFVGAACMPAPSGCIYQATDSSCLYSCWAPYAGIWFPGGPFGHMYIDAYYNIHRN